MAHVNNRAQHATAPSQPDIQGLKHGHLPFVLLLAEFGVAALACGMVHTGYLAKDSTLRGAC